MEKTVKYINESDITNIEKISMVHILISLMNVDESVHPEEERQMYQILKTININDNDFEKARRQNTLEALCIIKAMIPDLKGLFADFIINIIKADGEQHPNEYRFVRSITELCDLPIKSGNQ